MALLTMPIVISFRWPAFHHLAAPACQVGCRDSTARDFRYEQRVAGNVTSGRIGTPRVLRQYARIFDFRLRVGSNAVAVCPLQREHGSRPRFGSDRKVGEAGR